MFMTRHLKHFMKIGVSATGQYSFRQHTDSFFSTGMIIFENTGITAWLREILKMFVRSVQAEKHTDMYAVRTCSFPRHSVPDIYCRQRQLLVSSSCGRLICLVPTARFSIHPFYKPIWQINSNAIDMHDQDKFKICVIHDKICVTFTNCVDGCLPDK